MRAFAGIACLLLSQSVLLAQPIDLKYVPEGGMAAVVVHPQQMLTREVFEFYPTEVLSAWSQETLGANGMEMESAVLILLPNLGGSPTPVEGAGIFRFSQALAQDQVIEKLKTEKHSEQVIGGKKAYVYEEELDPMHSFAFADEQTILFGSKPALQKMLTETPGEDDALIQRLKPLDRSMDIVGVAPIKPFRLFLPLLDQLGIPPQLEKYKEIPKLLDTVQVHVQLEAVQTFELTLIANDEAAAQKLEQLFQEAIMMGKQIAEAQLTNELPFKDDPEMAAATQAWMQRLMKLGEERLSPKRQGDRLVLHLEGRNGLKELGLLGALMPMMVGGGSSSSTKTFERIEGEFE